MISFLISVLFTFNPGIYAGETAKNQKIIYDSTYVAGSLLDGRLFEGVVNETYQRMPTTLQNQLSDVEKRQASRPVGLFYSFRTNSSDIGVIALREGVHMGTCNGPVSSAGFDMYIRKDGHWLWAGSVLPKDNKVSWIVSNMDSEEKECLLYLPIGCKVESLFICHSQGSCIEQIHPFDHKIAVFGSSFTEGAGTSRSGMTWTAQLSRTTGLLFCNFGFSGNCRLQPYFAELLAGMDVDAYVIDAFSNPSVSQIRDRLDPFIQTIRKRKPDVPLIFLKSVYREIRNFDTEKDISERGRESVADSLMKIAVKKYSKVYWITTTNITDRKYRETSVDGTHPSDYGYTLWMESVKRPILKLLSRNGIRSSN